MRSTGAAALWVQLKGGMAGAVADAPATLCVRLCGGVCVCRGDMRPDLNTMDYSSQFIAINGPTTKSLEVKFNKVFNNTPAILLQVSEQHTAQRAWHA